MAYRYLNNQFNRYDEDKTVFDSINGNRIEGVKHFAVRNQLCTVDSNGHCPLAFAINSNKPEIIEFLVAEYTKIDGKNPVLLVVYIRELYLIKKILKNTALLKCLNYCDSNGHSPLAHAVHRSEREIIDCLITAGADVNIFGKNGAPPLSAAVENQDFEMVKYLIEKGAKRSIQTAFLDAIEMENLKIIKYLHEQGALINFTYLNDGSTPLINSIKTGNPAIVRYFIQNGANVEDTKDDKHQLLWKYIKAGNNEMVSLLIKLGVNLEQTEPNGCTPLTYAVELNNFEYAEQLIKAGASVNRCDKNNKYPLSVAISNCSPSMTELLIESGADMSMFEKEIAEFATWNHDFCVYLQSKKLKSTRISMETGHEEAPS